MYRLGVWAIDLWKMLQMNFYEKLAFSKISTTLKVLNMISPKFLFNVKLVYSIRILPLPRDSKEPGIFFACQK